MKDFLVKVRVEKKFLAPLHGVLRGKSNIGLCAKAGNKLDRPMAVREGDDAPNARTVCAECTLEDI